MLCQATGTAVRAPFLCPVLPVGLWSLRSSQLTDRETVVCAFVHFSGVNTPPQHTLAYECDISSSRGGKRCTVFL